MKKSKALFLVLLSLIAIGGSQWGLAYAQSSHINWEDCYGDKCIVHIPSLEQTPYKNPPLLSGGNVDIFIVLPDGTCNIIGHLQTDGSCNAPDLIISNDNYTHLQNDVAYMMVQSKDSIGKANTNFCPLAQSIWNGQTAEYQKKLVNVTQYVIPDYCAQELGHKVPEFGAIASIVLAISVMAMVVFVAKVRGKSRF